MESSSIFEMDLDADPKIVNTPCILDNTTEVLEKSVLDEFEVDAEDSLFNIVEEITNKLQENYEKLTGEDTDKKGFIKSLTRIFALLRNTKVDTVDKTKKY